MRQTLTLLGSTGSIGVNTLDVVARHPGRFEIVALSANNRHGLLLEQCLKFKPRYGVLLNEDAAAELAVQLRKAGSATQVLSGMAGLLEVATLEEVTTVVAAIVGAAGLHPTLAAVKKGKRVLLANKEALVMAGQMFMEAAAESGAQLLPIDSEHNAIFQSLPRGFSANLATDGVAKIWLTASGGPFLTMPLAAFDSITPEQACAHPNWVMGKKISVDSATMMNKGLEVIEARWLFNLDPAYIEIVIHPQSIVHSLVEYVDGSTLAQLGNPDMRTPIAHALGYPERIESGVAGLNLLTTPNLEFKRPDHQRFPCIALAYQALNSGGTAPAILNAANEEAVGAFLDHRIPFNMIPKTIAYALSHVAHRPITGLQDVLDADLSARAACQRYLTQEHVLQ